MLFHRHLAQVGQVALVEPVILAELVQRLKQALVNSENMMKAFTHTNNVCSFALALFLTDDIHTCCFYTRTIST